MRRFFDKFAASASDHVIVILYVFCFFIISYYYVIFNKNRFIYSI